MTTESDYYENDVFWDPRRTREEDIARVRAVAALVPSHVKFLLDVGCGNGLFVHELLSSGRVFERLHAADRSQTALRYVRTEKTQVRIDQLPFRHRRFEMVTCLEVLEHLQAPVFERGLIELCRVAGRYILVSVPFRQDLGNTLIACPSCHTLFNPDYHLRSFDEASLRTLLVRHGFNCTGLHPLGAAEHLRGLKSFLRIRGSRAGATNPFAAPIPCPACAFELPPARHRAGVGLNVAEHRRGLREFVKALWPKRIVPVWMAVLYERERL